VARPRRTALRAGAGLLPAPRGVKLRIGGRRRINAAVFVRIERARPLVSPAYELGDSELEITARMRKYFDDLLARRATSRAPK
jgi:hypothetical protein